MLPRVSVARRREPMNAREMSATASAVRTRPTRRVRITTRAPSYLDVDDPLDHEAASDDHQSGEHEQDLSRSLCNQGVEIVRVDDPEHEQQRDWERGNDPAGHPALNGQ